MNRDDQELLSRIAASDVEAFESFYDQHAPTLFGVLTKVLASRSEAEDVLQEAFEQVWRTAGSFDPRRGAAIGWLISIGRSRALDRLRSASLRTKREREAAIEDARFSPNGDQMSGFRFAAVNELREAVKAALAEIPDDQKRALELAYYKGMTQVEIAGSLGQPLGTVKTRMLLGMKKLRLRLERFYQEYSGS